jgi:hypothetical protein
MPRRMLRHRVIAQCARLAFGVSVPQKYLIKDDKNRPTNMANSGNQNTVNASEKLKKILGRA